ncbi:putative MFS monocarboxylate transporter [Xylariaceae sp. FL0016]|nr:putative MFS monocarboxylate transporter [Xylariaceae sp. FL0016]
MFNTEIRPSSAIEKSLFQDPIGNCSINQSQEKGFKDQVEAVHDDGVPDGGPTAWLQVLGSFSLFFNTWGMINTFGVFQTFYENELLSGNSPSAISWIGSLQSFFLLFVGVVSGPLYDAGYLRLLLMCGVVFVTTGMMATSFCGSYCQVMLAQGVCVGIGTGFLYIPSVAIIPQYFYRRKALAMGIVTSGSSLGGVLYPLIFQGLQPRVGFAWATRAMGFISLATMSIALLTLRRRVPATQIRSLLDLQAFRERPYVLYCCGICLSFVAFYAPVFYLQPYALTHGMANQPVSLYLIAILNAASIPGRLSPSFLARKIGPIHTLALSVSLTTITTFSWISVHSTPSILLFTIFFGFFSGGIVALPAVVLTSFTTDLSRLGTRLGMSSVLNAVGSLVGAPIGGAILGASGSYLGLQLYAGFVTFGTAVFLLALRVAIVGWKLKAKA